VTPVTDGDALGRYPVRMTTHINGFPRRFDMAPFIAAVFLLIAAALPAETAPDGPRVNELLAGMIAFDRAYIPALALSNQDKREASRKALAILEAEWGIFEKRFALAYSGEDWRVGFEQAGLALRRAVDSETDGDLAGTHAALEDIRGILLRLRGSRSIPYYLDYLNRYHEIMESIITASGEPAGSAGRLDSFLPEARREWESAIAAPFDVALYGFGTARAAELRGAELAVLDGIGMVEKARADGNRDVLVASVQRMKPAFTRVFLMFGDFERVSR
jgi:hypothetical protein